MRVVLSSTETKGLTQMYKSEPADLYIKKVLYYKHNKNPMDRGKMPGFFIAL